VGHRTFGPPGECEAIAGQLANHRPAPVQKHGQLVVIQAIVYQGAFPSVRYEAGLAKRRQLL
jgi:hypothetical protein